MNGLREIPDELWENILLYADVRTAARCREVRESDASSSFFEQEMLTGRLVASDLLTALAYIKPLDSQVYELAVQARASDRRS